MPVGTKEKTIGERTYRFRPIAPLIAGHVLRRLAPVLGAATATIVGLQAAGSSFKEILDKPESVEAIKPLLDGLSKMDDKDYDYVVNACLDVVDYQVNEAWQRLRASGGGLTNPVDLPEIYIIVGNSIAHNFSDFFGELLGLLFPQGSQQSS